MRDWRKTSLRDFLRRLILLGESADRVALAFAIGVFLSFSPFWGLHAVVGLVVAFVFRLNRVAVLVGIFVNSPWTVAPVASLGTALGLLILGTEVRLPKLAVKSIFSGEFWQEMLSEFENLFLPFLLGNLILALVAGLLAYFILRWILIQNARRRAPSRTG